MDPNSRLCVRKIDPTDMGSIQAVFFDCLVPKGLGARNPRYFPLQTTIETIQRLGARTVLIQRDVQDPDFLAEHSAYYSRWTGNVSKYCTRLHFFSEEAMSLEDPLAVIDQMWEIEDSYLGFVTLRPISMSPIAASILKPASYSQPCFILSKDDFSVHIAGRTFSVCGTPFMQQDNAVGACAQASIWMALRTLRKRAGHAAYSPAEITDAATRFYVIGRTMPNRSGLVVEQVLEAIRATGYAPHTLPLKKRGETVDSGTISKIKRTLYPYVESCIPTLLLLFPSPTEGHAVVMIGHGWSMDEASLILRAEIGHTHWEADLEIFDAAGWVEPFIIHNDNSGPYMQLPEKAVDDYCLSQAEYAIPLLHPDVFIDGSEAQECCLRLLSDSLNKVGSTSSGASSRVAPPKIVMRTYLDERASFRKSVLDGDAPPDVKIYYRKKWLPKRIWVTEFNLFENYGNTPMHGGKRLGEILIDPAAEAEEGAFLSIHLSKDLLPPNSDGMEGIIIDRDALDGRIYASPVSGHPAGPLVRDSV